MAAVRAVTDQKFTLQLALNAFQGELTTQSNYLLAMTVITARCGDARLRRFCKEYTS